MTNRLNIYHAIFAALFVLKIGAVGRYAEFSWLIVFTPLVVGWIHGLLSWVYDTLEVGEELRQSVRERYYGHLTKKATKKALEEIQKKQETTWPKGKK